MQTQDLQDDAKWQYDSAPEYDLYYSGGENSIYNNLYQDKFIPYDKWILQKTAFEIAENKESIKIIDFGCGNGRYLPIFTEIAVNFKKSGKELYLFAYDSSKEALLFYQKRLNSLGFVNEL